MSTPECIGRLNIPVPIASGVALNLRDYAGVQFVCTGADTFTITTSVTFGGSYATPGAIIDHYYQAAATNGTAAFTRVAQALSNAVVQASAYTTVIEVLNPMLPGLVYIKCTASAAGLVMANLHSLDRARKPANMAIVSA
jgi:hypothetical protein